MKLLKSVLTLSAIFSVTHPVQASEDIAVTLCEYVSVDDKNRLRKFLKTNNLKIRNVFDDVQCNGANLIGFADANNAVNAGTLIIKKLPKDVVASVLNSIGNADLKAAATERAG